MKNREDVIKNVVWARETGFLNKILQKKKKSDKTSKKVLKLITKINTIQQPIIDRVLFLYMSRQKFYYTIRFLQWLVNVRGDGYEIEQLQEMQEGIDQRGEWIY